MRMRVLHSKYNQETLNTLVATPSLPWAKCHLYSRLMRMCRRACFSTRKNRGFGSLLAASVRCSVRGALLRREDGGVLLPRRVWTFDFGQSEVVNCVPSVCFGTLCDQCWICLGGDVELPLLSKWKCYSWCAVWNVIILPLQRGSCTGVSGGAQLPSLGGEGRCCFSSTPLLPRAAPAPHLNKANLAKQKTPTYVACLPHRPCSLLHPVVHVSLWCPWQRSMPSLLALLGDWSQTPSRERLCSPGSGTHTQKLQCLSQAPLTHAGTVTKTVLYPDKA